MHDSTSDDYWRTFGLKVDDSILTNYDPDMELNADNERCLRILACEVVCYFKSLVKSSWTIDYSTKRVYSSV